MVQAHHDLPKRIDGAYRYSDPWFAAYIRRIFIDSLGLPEGQLQGLLDELFRSFEDPSTFELYPGTHELIASARAEGLCVGVISNWSARLPRVLEGVGLHESFDFVLCSAIEELEKPEVEIFQRALQKAGVAPREALHAGDHPEKDVAAAQRAGMEGVLVDHQRIFENQTVLGQRVVSLSELSVYVGEKISGDQGRSEGL